MYEVLKLVELAWLIPITIVSQGCPYPSDPDSWNHEMAQNRHILSLRLFPMGVKCNSLENQVKKFQEIYSYTSVDKNRNVGLLLDGICCWQCDRQIFLPPASEQMPHPLFCVKTESGELLPHKTCIMANPDHHPRAGWMEDSLVKTTV